MNFLVEIFREIILLMAFFGLIITVFGPIAFLYSYANNEISGAKAIIYYLLSSLGLISLTLLIDHQIFLKLFTFAIAFVGLLLICFVIIAIWLDKIV